MIATLFAVLAAWLAGCGGPTFIVQQYPGPPQPTERVAIIRIPGGIGPEIVSLDGEPLQTVPDQGTRLHIEVLPGTHEAQLVDPESKLPIVARFVAEPGKVYRVVLGGAPLGGTALPQPGPSAVVYEVDRDSDAPIRIAAPPPAPPAPAPAPPGTGPSPPSSDAGAAPARADAQSDVSMI